MSSMSYLQGIQNAFDYQAQIRNDIHVVATNWFVNRCPLITRIPRVPAGSTSFSIVSRSVRPRAATLSAALNVGDTQLALVDSSPYMVGDVLELASGERIEIVADPNIVTGLVTIRRGVESTTPAAQPTGSLVRLIGNSRTGSEINQSGVAIRPTAITQYCQTFQHPVQIGGSLQASTSIELSSGVRTPFDQNKMDALQNLMDDIEVSSYYGRGEDPSVGGRPKQKGVRTLISPSNIITVPTNAGAYKATDLIRDTMEKCRTNGGDPDVLLVSSNFMTGLATWGQAVMRIDAGRSVFGLPIDVFEAPFLGGVSIIEAPLLRPYTAFCLTSSEIRLRMKRNEFWMPRGSRGDAYEGDWVAEGAIELENPLHHAWVEGITSFSAS